jgi:hypothetical protein
MMADHDRGIERETEEMLDEEDRAKRAAARRSDRTVAPSLLLGTWARS